MSIPHDPAAWISRWPHDKIPLWETWREVHARFGLAASKGTELETALTMLISQMEQMLTQKLQLEDLLSELRDKGMLPLGALNKLFLKIYRVPENDELAIHLTTARKSRNYLIHHFYRDRADLFTTPEGCERAADILVSIYEDLVVAVESLEHWRDAHFGYRPPEETWDHINQDVTKWKDEQKLMLDAFLGINKRKD